ncbi:MAG: Protein kinase [Myxococcaceae bacterium]|nr:Protein kinase [Myxococcaceae bacterium]
MRTTHALVLVSLVLSVSCKKAEKSESTASADPANGGSSVAGTYTIKSASNPGGGGGYGGSVDVTKGNGFYNLVWTIKGSQGYNGLALQDGDNLGVGWGQGGDFGVVVYKINGGKLTGRWATHGSSGVGTEDLDGPATLGGTYKITKSATPEGKSYTGDVVITQKGDTYLVTWKLGGGETYDGAAIKEGDRLIVGWGRGGKGAGVVSYTVKGSQLDGKWATAAGGALGTEILTK